MCIGIPMRVLECHGTWALAEGCQGVARVDLMLVGPQPVGSWLLVHIDTAREVIDGQRAAEIATALEALEAARAGVTVAGLFQDLEGREPQLPAHLRPQDDGDGSQPESAQRHSVGGKIYEPNPAGSTD
ncbi:HypC/HybG/HupF family hydrogenase formation chaperone [Alkalilimnicola ehrlichii MLHE-1]|uniref:Hydrogenase assembly chaperone hypC/hupF n=1 Tax=Alkalilimnicola ehrlichii (strain ATCC BAA-1101 / DSM 17681 / MLHE-1) TaxID=187272 RepID=Q0A720_ALKEH|nr:HypC/HybG/HupF family hydrogenase formation chaperone [Alkalilimnicola ehrlichii]ABI57367.1 hydrogenase assembly chaperone hypC/hupF [Alkalilimnicola ehrlichii MLHE-1]